MLLNAVVVGAVLTLFGVVLLFDFTRQHGKDYWNNKDVEEGVEELLYAGPVGVVFLIVGVVVLILGFLR